MGKKHYKVNVYVYGESGGNPFKRLYEIIETWAVSAAKAECNARFRMEGKNCRGTTYGDDLSWSSYSYEAIQI